MQGVIESVTTKNGTSQAGKPWTLFKIKIGGTEYSSFDANMGSQAMTMQGHNVEFSHTEKQNGAYVNRTLTALIGANAPAVQPSVAPLAQPVAQAPDTKGEDIKRAVVFKKACDIVGATWTHEGRGAWRPDEICTRVDALFAPLLYILEDAGKSTAEVASEVFDATTETSEEQEPLI